MKGTQKCLVVVVILNPQGETTPSYFVEYQVRYLES